MGGPRPMSELESTQTVSQVAQAMLCYWDAGCDSYARVTTNAFNEYWEKYAG